MTESGFARTLAAWQRTCGRTALPWQRYSTPYERLVSEVMLQQTQVETVIPYYERFLERFPTAEALARAPDDALMALWAGLGYYARARNLRRAAAMVVDELGGIFPATAEGLERLPGVGPSTAAAVAAFTSGEAERPMVDGNVKRVIARVAAIPGRIGEKAFERAVEARARELLPGREDVAAYTQGLMDLGSLVCRKRAPACGACPVRAFCKAARCGDPEAWPAPKKPLVKRERRLLAAFPVTESGLWLRPGEDTIWRGLWGPVILEVPVGEARFLNEPEPFGFSADWEAIPIGSLRRELTHQRLFIDACALVRAAGAPGDARLRAFGRDPQGWPGMAAPIRTLAERAMRAAGYAV